MSSSVIRRNQQLTLLDDKFDKFMDQYDEAEEGGLEGEDIEGYMDEDGERMKQLLEDNEKEKATRRQQLDRAMEITKAAIRQSYCFKGKLQNSFGYCSKLPLQDFFIEI